MSFMVTADDFKDYKKGFNNQYVCFEYPFLWNDIKSEEEDEFTDVVLHDRQHNPIVKISTKPCTFNTVDELKEAVEVELKENNCEIQQSAVESLEKLDIWDIFYTTEEEGLEIEQFHILKDNNLYTLELYTKNNRDPVIVNEFVKVIQSFKILKPSYKITEEGYEHLE